MNTRNPRNSADGDNKMATMPIGPLLASMALPMMLSFFIQAMYNIVDSMFVARISENALTAVSLAFPMQQLENAIAVGTGVGINATIPRLIGSGDRKHASEVANTGIFLNLCHAAVFIVLGITISHAFFQMQTDVEEIVEGGTIYLMINWIVCAGNLYGQYFEKMLTASGRATLAMASQASGAVFNIVFDPLLIFGIGPFPRMGIAGAAVATVLGQILGAVIACTLNLKRNEGIQFSFSGILHPSRKAAAEIYGVGIPSMITIGLTSISAFFINQILLAYSTTATAVYGIWVKLQNFCYMPAFGMNNGMVPILAYNYGTGAVNRVHRTVRLAVTSILMLMIVLTVVFEFIPGVILMLFDASSNMMSIGIPALRATVASLVFGGTTIVLTSAMQSLSHARYTLVTNILRNLVVIVTVFYLFNRIFGELEFVWMAVPVSEAIVCGIALMLFRKTGKDLEKKLQ